MTDKQIEQINAEFKGKVFSLIGDHYHAGSRVKCIEFSRIKGCKKPGMLVKNYRLGKEKRTFRVFNLNNFLMDTMVRTTLPKYRAKRRAEYRKLVESILNDKNE